MVYAGPSQACATCKLRRIKCDLTRPSCKNCLRKGVVCPGFKDEEPFRFQDETEEVVERVEREKRSGSSRKSRPGSQPLMSISAEDMGTIAHSFFSNNYSLVGRGEGFITDFIKIVTTSLLPSVDQSSALFKSYSTLAQCVFALWSGTGLNTPEAQIHMGRALSAIQQALNDPEKQLSDQTLAAVLLLNIADSLYHWSTVQRTGSKHQEGASAMISHRGNQNFESQTSIYLWLFARHSEIDLAIQEHKQIGSAFVLPAKASSWNDPLVELDSIGIEIANLNSLYYDVTPIDSTMLIDVIQSALQIDAELKAWADALPPTFRPDIASVHNSQSVPIVSTDSYREYYEIYQSSAAAGYWSFYRTYRLLLQKILVHSHDQLSEQHPDFIDNTMAASVKLASETLQQLVDDASASVPYYLASRDDPMVIRRFEQSEFEEVSAESSGLPTRGSQQLEKMRNAIALGGWRIGAFLGQILDMLTGDDAYIFQPLLRTGQQEWLERQLKRIMRLHCMDTPRSTVVTPKRSPQSR